MRAAAFHLFVYGTLRRGGRWHEGRCDDYLAAVGARVPHARLWLLPAGYPGLEVRPGLVLARASPDAEADAMLGGPVARPVRTPDGASWVEGDLLTFLDDGARRLAELDAFEECRPGASPGHVGQYERVLLPVRADTGAWVTAWCYVLPVVPPPGGGVLLETGSWLG